MKKIRHILLISFIVSLSACCGYSVCYGEEAQQIPSGYTKECHVCGMYIERFKRTAAYIDYTDGKMEAYCGVSCAIRVINEKGGFEVVKSADVTGWNSQKRIPMKDATYVIGSRLIPDMIPNIIAFDSEEEAKKFIEENGGRIESLDNLFVSTSYRGLTAPFRIPSAAIPSQGVFNAASTFNYKRMDKLMKGDGRISKEEAYKYRKMLPDTMTAYMFPQSIGYGVTDDLFCSAAMAYAVKEMRSVKADRVNIGGTDTKGISDLTLTGRWRVWHDAYFDKHVGILGAMGVPTGRFNNSLRDKPGVQLGTGAFSFTPGLLYSQHLGEFWVHLAGTYTFNLKNPDDYKFGDMLNYGFAIHWLPNTADLLGFELDTNHCLVDESYGNKVENTGRISLSCNLVYQRKIFLLWGGNMSVFALIGMPVYEHVKNVQLGESWHSSTGLQWQRKF